MTHTTRSLFLALLACLSMGLFAQSLRFSAFYSSLSYVFILVTFGLGMGGWWVGIRGARKQRTIRAWLAPALNGFLIVVFFTYLFLFWQALGRLQ